MLLKGFRFLIKSFLGTSLANLHLYYSLFALVKNGFYHIRRLECTITKNWTISLLFQSVKYPLTPVSQKMAYNAHYLRLGTQFKDYTINNFSGI